MALWTAIGVLIPIFLIFGRRINTPHGWVVLRCAVALFVAWIALVFGSEHYVRERGLILIARGAMEESMALDGVMFSSLVMGWLPALIFVVALAWLRRLAVVLRWNGKPGYRIAFVILALAISGFWLWRSSARARYAPARLKESLPRITEVTIYSVPAPVSVNEMAPFETAGHATMPVDVFISAAKSAQYSGPSATPAEPGLVAFVDFDFTSDRRARLAEDCFAFEGLDGFFTVTGQGGGGISQAIQIRKGGGVRRSAAQRAGLDQGLRWELGGEALCLRYSGLWNTTLPSRS